MTGVIKVQFKRQGKIDVPLGEPELPSAHAPSSGVVPTPSNGWRVRYLSYPPWSL